MPAAGASPLVDHREQVRPAPLTIPALQQWDPAYGVWRLGTSVKIAVRRDQPTARYQAEVLSADLEHATRAPVRVAIGATPHQGDIVMRTVAANPRLGREGYRLRVGGVPASRTPVGAVSRGETPPVESPQADSGPVVSVRPVEPETNLSPSRRQWPRNLPRVPQTVR